MQIMLNNPIWHALTTNDAHFNRGNNELAFFDTTVAPFIGMAEWNEIEQQQLVSNAPNRSWFLLIKHKVKFIPQLELVKTMPLFQLIGNQLINEQPLPHCSLVPLTSSHIDEMIALTQLTQPGPFRENTIAFGNYWGIFEHGKLTAMGGERLHLPMYTEISAICTHPQSQGKGYAKAITHFLAQNIIKTGKIPFLHVRTNNVSAIQAYTKVGFQKHQEINFYLFKHK